MELAEHIELPVLSEKNHRLDLMAGHEMVSNYRNQMIASSKYYPMDFTASEVLAMWNYGESQPTYTTLGEPSRTASYFGRLNYAFKDRYMFTLQPVPTERMCSLLKTVGDFSRVWHWHGAFPRKNL